ncbi:hypothetical protein RND71_032036 [Anisodus tanguticus]|uniref:Uncharacterized protein n=1 Tax=Anisodus tanguticus TaxID=243964 RepID=A0AAE1RDT3_9SOLA|nr:hypothetical protein RND71_032036 [Anisodus tanguticus]
MEDRDEDLIVPLISCFFCICVTLGGVFLVIYLFVPNISQPWFLPVALLLVGSPWIFWFLTYMYTCIKRCCCSTGKLDNRHISRGTSRASTMSNPGMARNVSTRNSTNSRKDNNDEKHVKFAGVVETKVSGHSNQDA